MEWEVETVDDSFLEAVNAAESSHRELNGVAVDKVVEERQASGPDGAFLDGGDTHRVDHLYCVEYPSSNTEKCAVCHAIFDRDDELTLRYRESADDDLTRAAHLPCVKADRWADLTKIFGERFENVPGVEDNVGSLAKMRWEHHMTTVVLKPAADEWEAKIASIIERDQAESRKEAKEERETRKKSARDELRNRGWFSGRRVMLGGFGMIKIGMSMDKLREAVEAAGGDVVRPAKAGVSDSLDYLFIPDELVEMGPQKIWWRYPMDQSSGLPDIRKKASDYNIAVFGHTRLLEELMKAEVIDKVEIERETMRKRKFNGGR